MIGDATISFSVAVIIWSAASVLFVALTAVAVFFAKSWKLRIDRDYNKMSDKVNLIYGTIDSIKEEHNKHEVESVKTYVDYPVFNHQVSVCSGIQQRVFDKVEQIMKELSIMNTKIVAFKADVITEIKNGHDKKNK